MSRKITKTLRHPVTGAVHKFVIDGPESYATFKRYQQDWQPRQAKQESGIRNQPLDVSTEEAAMNPTGLTAGEQWKLATPSIAAMLATSALGGPWMQGVRYAPLLRMLAAGGAGAGTAPIAGTDPVGEAATQMAVQVPGEMLAGLTAGAGRGLQRRVFNNDPVLNESFGDIGGSASRERIGPSNLRTLAEGPEPAGLGEKALGNFRRFTGSEAASEELNRLKPRITAVLAKDPTEHVVGDVLNDVHRRLIVKLGRRPQHDELMTEVEAVLKGIADENPTKWDNVSAWEKHTGAQDVSVDLLAKRARPSVGNAAADNRADAEQLVNAELQKVLNERLHKVPGYSALNTKYREFTGIRRAAKASEVGRDATASPRAVMGGGQPRMAINPLDWMSPQQMSGLGRALEHPVTQPFGHSVLPRLLLEGARRDNPSFEPMDIIRELQMKHGEKSPK